MRLGDLDALRKNMEFICMGIMAGTEPYNAPLTEIDNAPTVKPYCYFCGQKEHGQTVERPHGEWIEKVERRGCFAGDKTVYSYTCPFCGAKEFKKYPFCHCGADMRKPNCVTCDHFGKCEGCEKRDEE